MKQKITSYKMTTQNDDINDISENDNIHKYNVKNDYIKIKTSEKIK